MPKSEARLRTRAFSIKGKYLMLYRIQSLRLYCFLQRGCWNHRPVGPYFSAMVHISSLSQCSNRQGSCLLLVYNTHTPCGSELCGDVLHEGITYLGYYNVESNLPLHLLLGVNTRQVHACIPQTAKGPPLVPDRQAAKQ